MCMSDSKKKPQNKTTKKQPAKKTAAKKQPAKKAAAKKPAPKKPTAKKQPAKAKAAPKKKQSVESSFDAIEAHETAHEFQQLMAALEDTIKIDFTEDPRDTIVEWAKEWVDEENEEPFIATRPTPKKNKNFLKRFIASFIKR